MNTVGSLFEHFDYNKGEVIRDTSNYPLISVKLANNIHYEFREREHIFLTRDNYDLVQDMPNLRSAVVINDKGKEVLKKKFLLGINEAKISKVSLRKTKKDSLYIKVEFERKSCVMNGTRINFAPFTDRFFKIEDEDSSSFGRIQQLIRELGEDLKPRPANYPIEDYIKAVARRIRDNSTSTIKVAVRLNKELIRDDYGELESRFPTIAFKEEVVFYGSFKYDWAKSIIPFNDRDKNDYEFYTK